MTIAYSIPKRSNRQMRCRFSEVTRETNKSILDCVSGTVCNRISWAYKIYVNNTLRVSSIVDEYKGIGAELMKTKKYKLYIIILQDYEIVREVELPADLTDEEVDKQLSDYTDRLINDLQLINFSYDEIEEE